jgi:hypothetical protein
MLLDLISNHFTHFGVSQSLSGVGAQPTRGDSGGGWPLSRPARAHWRLSWAQRLARNARAPAAGPVTLLLFGVPAAFARFLGLAAA